MLRKRSSISASAVGMMIAAAGTESWDPVVEMVGWFCGRPVLLGVGSRATCSFQGTARTA